MKWAELRGNSQERYCEQCSLHVQNLSSMTRVRASEFLAESKASSERICVTFVRRPTSLIRM